MTDHSSIYTLGKEPYEIVRAFCPDICSKMNEFSIEILVTRGGRIGSGMGALLEGLWGYMANQLLFDENEHFFDIAWMPDNQYNDFTIVEKNVSWNPDDRTGELFRIEAKSMNRQADESKAHFDVLKKELGKNDSLLILVWEWAAIDKTHRYPKVIDYYFGRALDVVELRDTLHVLRGGSFVSSSNCPDGCNPATCPHDGEPLNASRIRERLSGPDSTKGNKVSYAANFGGLVRMLKTSNTSAKSAFQKYRSTDTPQEAFISFIFRNYPDEEKNHYGINQLRAVARQRNIDPAGLSKEDLYDLLKHDNPNRCIEELRYCN
ncbi:MAG: hypothetical protein LKE37_08835 [Atopobiaceae bacterium]|nr:hypothetical protein [Atopobiaceae bacterium]